MGERADTGTRGTAPSSRADWLAKRSQQAETVAVVLLHGIATSTTLARLPSPFAKASGDKRNDRYIILCSLLFALDLEYGM